MENRLKFPDDCPFNSFVYVTRKISETKASAVGAATKAKKKATRMESQ